MNVRLANLQDRPVDEDRLCRVLAFAMGEMGIPGPVSLAVVDDGKIAELNRRFSGRDGPTDVLAFPLEDPGAPDPDPELGEIVVSADTAFLQAEEAEIPFEKEMSLLALHGLLHLAGWNDADPGDREAMLRRGDELLEAFEKGESTQEEGSGTC